MKYVFAFNEINYGRVEVEADRTPDRGEVIEAIMHGKAHYNDTEYEGIILIEADGKAQTSTEEEEEDDD